MKTLDYEAKRIGQEVASDVESVENGTKTDLGTAINYPRTSVRDALKRLEQKGVVQITQNEDGTFEYRMIALL